MATAVITAVALAAPVAGASAAIPIGFEPWVGQAEYVYGGLAYADVFNGGTTVVVSTGAAQANTIGSP